MTGHDWFHDPDGLRVQAIEFDRKALESFRAGDECIAYAWEGKARALRARARTIADDNRTPAA